MNKQYFKERFPRLSNTYKLVKRGIRAFAKCVKYYFYKIMPVSLYPYFLSKMYKKYQGVTPDIRGGVLYTEKMQRAKLYDTDPRKSLCSDKYLVRDWVAERIGEEYLISLIGHYDNSRDIDFSSLPDKFVLKTNHASNDVIIVRDKKNLSDDDISDIRKSLNKALKRNYALVQGFEMHYTTITPCIIAEEMMSEEDGSELKDYKFLCFDGIPYYCWVDCDRHTNHTRNVYDMEWNLMPWNQGDIPNSPVEISKPINFDKMVSVVKTLSKGFSHVRVDLYNIQGKIYFGEMTFTGGSGFTHIPEKFNRELGLLWKLDC